MSRNPVLLIVDFQHGFNDLGYWGERNNPDAEVNAARVLASFRAHRRPIIHVRHDSTSPTSPLRRGHPGNAFLPFAEPQEGECVIGKNVNSGFIGTDLEARLRALDAGPLVIMGISTDHCVSTTTRMAANLGFPVLLVGDACFAFVRHTGDGEAITAENVHRTELAILNGEFAQVVQASDIDHLLNPQA
jgi:nicotinamidase-related amidase